ncbi:MULTISPECIES: hypothetical protein [Anaerolinea]|nr:MULTISPECIES: hypothetical protein [Anaerolinea]GAP07486.1 hypothetical protein ATHL_02369 [Anaerolinea thermolimosa]
MRKTIVFMLALVLLAGCSLRATPTPTAAPRPTPTPTEEVRYYPTVSPDIRTSLVNQLPSDTFPSRYYEPPEGNYFVAMTVSTGETGQMTAGKWTLDVLWVYERNASVVFYPLVLGVWDGNTYTPYLFPAYDEFPTDRESYFRYLDDNRILERGRLIFPRVQGDFVSRTGIDWQKCGESTFCQVGRFMQETYNLDRVVELGIVGVNYPIPEGWALAWYWIPSTEKNTMPGFDKVDLPGGE